MAINKKTQQFQRGLKAEMSEHKWMPKWMAEKLVTDHVTEHPGMYKNKRKS